MKKGFIFDLDGTLVNTLADLAASMNSVLAREGYPEHPPEAYRLFVGNGILKLVERALPRENRGRAEELKPPFLEDYWENCLARTVPYPGIPELLAELGDRKIPLGILTNKAEPLAVKIVRALFSEDLVENLKGAREGIPLKPHPDAALALSEGFGLHPREVVFVGDSAIDVETALKAGMMPCGVRWGFRSEEELLAAGAERLVSHPRELLELIS